MSAPRPVYGDARNEASVVIEEADRVRLIARTWLDRWAHATDRHDAEDCIAGLRRDLLAFREGIRALRLSPARARCVDLHAQEKERCYLPRWEARLADFPAPRRNVLPFPPK